MAEAGRGSADYVGVAREGSRWRASITIGGTQQALDCYPTAELAAFAVDRALVRPSQSDLPPVTYSLHRLGAVPLLAR